MEFKSFKNKNRYNLFVSAGEDSWESNSYIMDRSRCLTSFTTDDVKNKYACYDKEAIEKIMSYPCLFVYEKGVNKDATIGYLTDIKIRKTGIKFTFEKLGTISLDNLNELTFELDIDMKKGITELMHTHWTIKEVNLYQELYNILSTSHTKKVIEKKPTVFISYCWSPKENKERVEKLVLKLENDGVNVLYDKNSLRPGQDMNVFMESLNTNTEIKKVLIICNKDYVIKADSRQGGVGTESEIIIPQVYGKPMQNKIIPIFFEKDDNNKPIIPIYLISRLGIDLTDENELDGYKDLIEDIFR